MLGTLCLSVFFHRQQQTSPHTYLFLLKNHGLFCIATSTPVDSPPAPHLLKMHIPHTTSDMPFTLHRTTSSRHQQQACMNTQFFLSNSTFRLFSAQLHEYAAHLSPDLLTKHALQTVLHASVTSRSFISSLPFTFSDFSCMTKSPCFFGTDYVHSLPLPHRTVPSPISHQLPLLFPAYV